MDLVLVPVIYSIWQYSGPACPWKQTSIMSSISGVEHRGVLPRIDMSRSRTTRLNFSRKHRGENAKKCVKGQLESLDWFALSLPNLSIWCYICSMLSVAPKSAFYFPHPKSADSPGCRTDLRKLAVSLFVLKKIRKPSCTTCGPRRSTSDCSLTASGIHFQSGHRLHPR